MVAESSSSSSSSSDVATAKEDAKGGKAKKKKVSPLQHLLAGGTAGFVESSICHPLDTIKTRMQLRRQTSLAGRALSGSGGGSLREASTTVRAGGASAAAAASSTTTTTTAIPPGGAHPTTTNHEPTGWRHRVVHPSSSNAAKAAFSTAASSSLSSSATTTTTTTTTTVTASLGPFGTAKRIVQREGPMALYKGLTAVYTGIIPKMAIRFVSFEYYRDVLGSWHERYVAVDPSSSPSSSPTAAGGGDKNDRGAIASGGGGGAVAVAVPSQSVTFLAGLLSGLTEAVVVVTPAEVCKIRMQSQYHSMMDPSQRAHAKYKNVVQTAMLVVKEEGLGALYKGVVPTMLRQGCNQAVNFTAYNWSKRKLLEWRRGRDPDVVQLEHWQTLVLGGLSGGMGPLVNNPLDVVKTRMQKQVVHPGREPKYNGLLRSCVLIAREEGTRALWKGITPRLMRIMPGQAITFMTYEAVTVRIERYGLFD
ncbi:hypothetical protein ACHAW5_000953 [Stephanodiscus triporus]|uniref:Mitochondrial carrier protein n=1 Tax=Stephanodiscus triporus TaxID=2934178 RepID=A0ABD3N750_9STRA